MSAVLQLMHKIRPMREADVPAALLLDRASYEFPWTAGNFIDSIHAGYRCWVYEAGGEVVGHAIMMSVVDEAHLLNLAISPNWQRQGLGRALLQYVLLEARLAQIKTLFLEVRPSNATAIRLYNRNGFEGFAIRKDYYPAREGREDALVMRCAL
jgi:[ribosomal protein S18]-alanine N-acetyltransferase